MTLQRANATITSNQNAVGTNQTISSVGFQAKVLLFMWGGPFATAQTLANQNLSYGFGVAIDGANQWGISNFITANVGTSNTSRLARAGKGCICSGNGSEACDGQFDFQAMTATGFTIKVQTQWVVNRKISYLALGGDSIVNAAAGATAATLVPGGTQSIDCGFQPDFVLVASPYLGSSADAAYPSARFSIGMASSATDRNQQACYGMSAADGLTTTQDMQQAMHGYICASQDLASSGAPIYLGHLSSFDPTGFTITWDKSASVDANKQYTYWLAIQTSNHNIKVGSTVSSTSASDRPITGIGFKPEALIVIGGNQSETSDPNTPYTGSAGLSFGFSTSAPNHNNHAIADIDNVGTDNASCAIMPGSVYTDIAPGTTPTVRGLMTVASYDVDGFTLRQNTAEPTVEPYVFYAAIGPLEDVAPGPTLSAAQVGSAVHLSWTGG